MAHWAELNDNETVVRVIVCDADDGADGTIHPPAFCTDVLGGHWVRTYYATEGQTFAGIGDRWDEEAGDFARHEPEDDMDLQRLAVVEAFVDEQRGLNAALVDEDANHWDALDEIQTEIDGL